MGRDGRARLRGCRHGGHARRRRPRALRGCRAIARREGVAEQVPRDHARPDAPPRDGVDRDRLPDGRLGAEPLRRARRRAALGGDRRREPPRPRGSGSGLAGARGTSPGSGAPARRAPLRHASFPRARDGSPGRPPRARALALRLVADVLGPGDRGQPPDRGGLHHPRPFAHRGPCATHRSAALVRLAGGGRLAALRRRRGRGGRCGGGRGVPPDEARRGRRRAQARRGRSGRRRIGGRKARPRVPEQPARREPVVAHRDSAAATRTRSRDRPRSTRPGDSQPGSTCRRSTST